MSAEQLSISNVELDAQYPPNEHKKIPAILPINNQKKLAWQDLIESLKKWPVFFMLAYQDIKIRYQRSVLGPLWLTLSMAITVYSMGYLYAQLFNVNLQEYYPFLVTGMLGWSLILTLVLDYTDGFLVTNNLIKQIKLPYSLYIHRIATRNMLIFFHNLLVMIPIYIVFYKDIPINSCTLLLIPGLLLIYLNAFFYGMLIAMASARYRDIAQIIRSIMQVIFFLTPVMWQPEGLRGKRHVLVDINPFHAFLELIREPLLGKTPSLKHIAFVLIITLIGVLLSYKLFTKFRTRIIYWT